MRLFLNHAFPLRARAPDPVKLALCSFLSGIHGIMLLKIKFSSVPNSVQLALD